MSLKSQLPTRLEADACILEANRLPSYLVPALEYVSRRLAAKGLQITLVVATRDYQFPSLVTKNHSRVSVCVPTMTPVTPSSPVDAACSSGLITIKSLVRNRRHSRSTAAHHTQGLAKLVRTTTARSGAASHGLRTPATPASGITTTSSAFQIPCTTPATARMSLEQQRPPLRFIHATPLPAHAHKLIANTLARATRKFCLAAPLMAHEPSAFHIPPLVLHSSILQNETLHASEGLTVLSLDALYTFKAGLSHYAVQRAEFGSHFRLEDAVDDLRRYVLSSVGGGKRRLLKSTLMSAYSWLGPVNETALSDVMTMYSQAYGSAMETGVQDDLAQLNDGPALAASVALAKVVDGSAAIKTSKPLTELPRQATARLNATTIKTVPRSSLALVASPPATPHTQKVISTLASVAALPASGYSVQSQLLLPSMSAQNWILEEQSPIFDKDLVNDAGIWAAETSTTAAKMDMEPVDESKTEEVCVMMAQHPLPALPPEASDIPMTLVHASIEPALASPAATAAKTLRRASPPALRIQTSFPAPLKPTAQRKKTPMPASLLVAPILHVADDIPIEITIPESDNEAEYDANLTDFEDADLTARSPVKTPGGSMWLCIDDILSSYAQPRSPFEHRRKISCLFDAVSPLREKAAPMTPNGYDDISPITRGEWGFLMVGDQFRTRTATVMCV
ncbi:hypothetical protein BD289DRAFT_449313 [Coniella lustricola]|uniref:DUF7582 domain-containing protein n=1 Tax=Coniella lustricola TaxID=2025994 RepID=A0A2T3AN61_9PEZI|nr:hypothetical protein BD289DRAFT_449313 [Coniella lustricola]